MKKLTILATIAVLAICGSAMALTITVMGQTTLAGAPVQVVPLSWGPLFDYDNLSVNPLVDVNGVQFTVGAGQFVEPVNGHWSKSIDIAINPGDPITATVWATADGSGFAAQATLLAKTPGSPPAPSDFIYDFGAIDIPIPEPSMLLSGLALLLLRRKK